MAIIRWNPLNLASILEDDFDLPTIPGLSRLIGQGLNLYETKDEVVAEVAVPGIPEDKIDVTVDGKVVRVTGSAEEKTEDREKRRYYMSSMNTTFSYAFRLPESVKLDQEPKAEIENGVLMLSFPKVQKAAPKKISVFRKSKQLSSKKQ